MEKYDWVRILGCFMVLVASSVTLSLLGIKDGFYCVLIPFLMLFGLIFIFQRVSHES